MAVESHPYARRPIPRMLLLYAFFALLGVADVFSWGGPVGRHLAIDSAWTLASVLAAWECARAAVRSHGADRRVWTLFTAGCVCWVVGQIFWNYYDFGPGFPPGPTPADIGWLVFVPCCVAGFVFVVVHSRLGKALLALDVAILTCSASIVCITAFWLNIESSPLPFASRVTALLYPILFVTMTLTVLSIPTRRVWRDPTLRLMILGMGAQAVGFTAWTPAMLANTYHEGVILDSVWVFGLLAIARGARAFTSFPDIEGEGQLFGFAAYVPLAVAAVGVSVRIGVTTATDLARDTNGPLVYLVGAIVLLMIARLAITLRQGKFLLERTHEALSALKESEERFRAIFQWAPFGIEIADTEGRLVATNRALQDMLGYSEQELQDINYMQVSHPDDVAAEMALDEQLLAGQVDHYQLVKRHVRKDGQAVWTRLTASSIRGHDGMDRYAVGMVEDITERKRAEEKLEHQARHDSLTGLPNRLHLLDRLDTALSVARHQEGACSLLLMDLDRFKEINDTFGHPYGDALLCDVAERLRLGHRRDDTVGRLGGDEFAIVLPGAHFEDAQHMADAILAQFERPFCVMGQTLHVRTSIGIACFPEHGSGATELMRQADIAMYEAKGSGARAAVYSAEQDQEAQRRIMLAGALRTAIDDGQLILQYQPKAECISGQVVGVEALVRWNHPQFGMISPGEFIPLAEHSGLILPLTYWVVDAALAQAEKLHREGRAVRVWVNLSARTLHDRELPAMISRRLRDWNAEPSWLGLEVTESAVMEDPDGALEILEALTEEGIQIAIDDFGTGYSSLSYLQRLPVVELKIDRSFVLAMAHDHGDRSIVQATINLAHDLGLQVVAEGVEHSAGWRQLARLRCDLIQGYILAPPMPADDLHEWLRARDVQPRPGLLAL